MAHRPERLKATKLYGSDHVTEKPKTLQEKYEKPDPSQGEVNKYSTQAKSKQPQYAVKEVAISSNQDRKMKEIGNKLEDTKNLNSNMSQPEKKDTDLHFDSEWKKGLPKGFVTRTEMEEKIGRRKPLYNEKHHKPINSQTDSLSNSNKNKLTSKENTKPTVPSGFVTRQEMETRIKNRKTRSTKVTVLYPENDIKEQRNENHLVPPVKPRDVGKPDLKAKHFSKLENRTQVATTTVKEDIHPSRRPPKQSKNVDNKVQMISEGSVDMKPPITVNKKSDGKTAISKTNSVEANNDKRKPLSGTSDSNRLSSASTKKSNTIVTPRMTSTAIPKAPRNNAKTHSISGLKSESVKLLIMNANGKDDKGGTPAERRKNAIQNVVLKNLPHIVLFQEFSWVGITGKTWAKYPIPEHFVYKGHYDAGIMYDATFIKIQDLPASDIDTILSGLQSNANNRLKRTFPMDFNPVARMSISRVTAPTKPPLDFICISWHGNSNEKGGGRMKELKKIEYFEYFMEFLRNIREKYKLPILAAGDYNVDMYSIEHCVQSPFKLCIYEASMRRTVKGIVDFCVITDDLDFNDISWVNLERDTTAFHPNGVLDHDPIVGCLTVSAIGASGAALGFGQKKSWPSPIAKTK